MAVKYRLILGLSSVVTSVSGTVLTLKNMPAVGVPFIAFAMVMAVLSVLL